MNEKALHTLEFDKIIEILTEKAISPMGKEMAASLKPAGELSDVRLFQQETSEAVSMILRKGSIPLGGIRDIRTFLKRATAGGMLTIDDLLQVSDFLYVCRKINTYGKSSGGIDEQIDSANHTDQGRKAVSELLDPLFEGVQPINTLEKEINRCIMNQQELADDASPQLHTIRRNIKISNDRVREQLNSIIHSSTYKTMLQDNVVTVRNGRFCVPIRQECRSNFPGMVHDQSSTGATVFMEPMSVVQLNNRIKELHSDEKVETERILRVLSGMVSENADSLEANISILTHLDFVFAKGELSLSMDGTEPDFNNKGYINIKKGRHPLLKRDEVIPTDIYLGKSFTTLLITGPNTGGKTVTIKTVGLFTLMGQAGLHISASDHSELSFFDNVFADIGDEQSIEQSLSTFSSHMSNIVRILDEVTDDSLVLLDELGAGTDPTEGAALGVAILRYLRDRQIRTAVTTHYAELKVYALSTDGVENASCEFDVETLRPTYKLLIGIPGKSNAFAISRRLGLPDHIIDSAKMTISHQDERLEDIITDLEISKKTAIQEKERAEAFRRDAEILKKDFEKQKQKLEERRDKLMLEAKEESQKIMQKTREEADLLLKELQKQISAQAGQKELEQTRQKIKDKLSEYESDLNDSTAPRKKLKPIPKNLAAGDRVFIHSLNQTGSVIQAPDQNGEAMIQAGIMKIKLHISDMSLDEREERIKINAPSYIKASGGKSMSIRPEIDLRGCMVEEGIEKADKYLDDAYLSGLGAVTIIHGKGTGALRSAIQLHLKKHPHVKSYRAGQFGEGEAGVTIVELK